MSFYLRETRDSETSSRIDKHAAFRGIKKINKEAGSLQRCSVQHPDIECALVYYFNCSLGLPTLSSWVPFVPRVRIRQALSKRRQCLSKGSEYRPILSDLSLFPRIASFHFFSSFLLFRIRSAPNEGEDCYALVLCYRLFALACRARVSRPNVSISRNCESRSQLARRRTRRSAFINYRRHSLPVRWINADKNTFMLHVRAPRSRKAEYKNIAHVLVT